MSIETLVVDRVLIETWFDSSESLDSRKTFFHMGIDKDFSLFESETPGNTKLCAGCENYTTCSDRPLKAYSAAAAESKTITLYAHTDNVRCLDEAQSFLSFLKELLKQE